MTKWQRGWDSCAAPATEGSRSQGYPCRRNSTASMETAQLTITAAVVSIVNTLRPILEYMQNRAKRCQHEEDFDEDMDTDIPESTGFGNWDIMMAVGLVDTVECQFWTRQTSTDWWDHIVLQISKSSDHSQCGLQSFSEERKLLLMCSIRYKSTSANGKPLWCTDIDRCHASFPFQMLHYYFCLHKYNLETGNVVVVVFFSKLLLC
ncbi:uncharacterized protein LOC135980856 [Chrysemys picta bellii]|uniref:uncharacterized protein LOC135980856 n=1 Tax=Chrysemys picta bellii TaxID=8478 RepID=UPI0032B1B556